LLLLKKAAFNQQPVKPLSSSKVIVTERNAQEKAKAFIDQLMTVDELMDEFTM
jgi:hypothetical protein